MPALRILIVFLVLLSATVAPASFDPRTIVGGSLVDAADPVFRSTVLVDAGTSFCTGTMISAHLVATAAHCVTYGASHESPLPLDALRVYFPGSHGPHGIVRWVHISGFEVNPQWAQHPGQERDQADLALVRMSGMIPELYQPAELWPAAHPLHAGDESVLAGFGVSDAPQRSGGGVLRKAAVPIQDAAFGQTEVQLDQSGGSGACYGDSGGPAFIVSGDKVLFWGVASRGDADCAHRMFYTRVAPYQDWLKEAAVRLGSPLVEVP